MLAGHILNICKERNSKFMFHFVLIYEFLDALLQKFYIHLNYQLNYYFQLYFHALLVKTQQRFVTYTDFGKISVIELELQEKVFTEFH